MKTFVPFHGARLYLMATNSQNTVILLTAACRVVLFQRLDTGAAVSKLLESCTKRKEKYQGNCIQSKAKYSSNMLSRETAGHTSGVTLGPFLLCRLKRQESFVAKGDSMGGYLFWLTGLDWICVPSHNAFSSDDMYSQWCLSMRS